MDGIPQGLCYFPYAAFYLMWGIIFVIHIIILRKWLNNRAKNEPLLEMIKSLQTDNDRLKGKFSTLEKDKISLTNKT